MKGVEALAKEWADEPEPLTDLGVMVANARVLQPEPSVLEVALRIYTSPNRAQSIEESVAMAFNLIETIRAEEARRAGK